MKISRWHLIRSALIYPPGAYANTKELVELSKVAAKYGGMYISHMRSEGNRLLEAIQELVEISQSADIPSEIYHVKAIIPMAQTFSLIFFCISRLQVEPIGTRWIRPSKW
jgi:N-acyl-D-aspartate/D-glutamate deacylase